MLVFAIVFSTVAIAGAEDVAAYTDLSGVSAVSEKAYKITDAAGLNKLAELVNGGSDFAGVTVYLANDIVLNEGVLDAEFNFVGTSATAFSPIGNVSDGAFAGTFDGQNHTIKGLYINVAEKKKGIGLFGQTNGATIKNLALTDAYITVDKSQEASDLSRIGGIVGLATATTVENCYVSGFINGPYVGDGGTTYYGSEYMGGIVGRTDDGATVIKNCMFDGKVFCAYSTAAGILGRGIATIENCYVQGAVDAGSDAAAILSADKGSTVTNCYYLDETSDDSLATPVTADEAKTLAAKLGAAFKDGASAPILAWMTAGETADTPAAAIGSIVDYEAEATNNLKFYKAPGSENGYGTGELSQDTTVAKFGNASGKYTTVDAASTKGFVLAVTNEDALVLTPDDVAAFWIYTDATSNIKSINLKLQDASSSAHEFFGEIALTAGEWVYVQTAKFGTVVDNYRRLYIEIVQEDTTKPSTFWVDNFYVGPEAGADQAKTGVIAAPVETPTTPPSTEPTATYSYEKEAQLLNTMGLMVGDETGDLMLGKDLTRLEGIALYFAVTGQTAAANAMTDAEVESILANYKDAADIAWGRNFVAYAIKTGVSIGVKADVWGPNEPLQGRMFAKWAANFLGYADTVAYETALEAFVPAFAGDNAADLNRDHAAGILVALLSVENKNTGKKVLADLYDQFAKEGNTEYATAAAAAAKELNVEITEVPSVTTKATATVRQTNVKEFTVTFDKPVSGANLALKLGAIAINSTVTWDETNTTATIVPGVALTVNKEYTIEISGVEVTANNLKIVATAAKASSLVFAPTAQITKAAVKNGAAGEGYVSFSVLDQFGNEMKASQYTASNLYVFISGATTANRGTGSDNNKIVFTFAYDKIEADKEVSYTIIDSGLANTTYTGTFVPYGVRDVASVTFGEAVGSLQNGVAVKTADDAGKLTDGELGFYIPVTAYDQYNEEIKADASLVATLNAKLDAISIGDGYYGYIKLLTKAANGVEKNIAAVVVASAKTTELAKDAALTLKAGTYTFKFLSTMNPAAPVIVDTPAFEVAEAFKIVSVAFDVSALDGMYKGESSQSYKITFTAVDQVGNTYTSLTGKQLATYLAASTLSDLNAYVGSTSSSSFSYIKVKSGSATINGTALNALAVGKQSFTVTPKSGATETYSFTVNEAQEITQVSAFPNVEMLINTPYSLISKAGGKMDGTVEKFVGVKLVAQDGTFYDADRGSATKAAASIKFTSDDYTVDTSVASVYTFKDKSSGATLFTIDSATSKTITFTGAKAGTYKVKAYVDSATYGVVNEVEFTVTVHDLKEISSIEIDGANVVNGSGNYGTAGASAYAEDYKIYGYIGTVKYDISTAAANVVAFNATAAGNATGFAAAGNVEATLGLSGTSAKAANSVIVATFNNGSKTLTTTKTVEVSKAAPAIAEIKAATDDEDLISVSGLTATIEDSAARITEANFGGKSIWGGSASRATAYIKVVDQYGATNYSDAPIAFAINYTLKDASIDATVTIDRTTGVLTFSGADAAAARVTKLEVTAIWADGTSQVLTIKE